MRCCHGCNRLFEFCGETNAEAQCDTDPNSDPCADRNPSADSHPGAIGHPDADSCGDSDTNPGYRDQSMPSSGGLRH